MDSSSFQKDKFSNFRSLNDNDGDKLALSHNFSNPKGGSTWVMITRTSLGEGPILHFGFMGGAPLWTLVYLQPLLYTMSCCWNNSVWWNYFSCRLVCFQSPLAFIFCHVVGLVFQAWYKSRRKANSWLNCQFSRTNVHIQGVSKKSCPTLNLIFWKNFASHITLNCYFHNTLLFADYSEQLLH